MGCDIHLYVESRESAAHPWKPHFKLVKEHEGTPDEYATTEGPRFYSSRNYDLFAILAGVRNGSGFAGCDTGDGFNPIADPRGIPDDASEEFVTISDQWGCDGHSHSWLTVSELLAYDWTQTTKHRGIVDPTEWAQWKTRGKPACWCGGVGGGLVSQAQFDEAWAKTREAHSIKEHEPALWHLKQGSKALDTFRAIFDVQCGPYCQVEWEEPYFVSAGEFLSTTMPHLWRLGSPDNVRIVFFFDN